MTAFRLRLVATATALVLTALAAGAAAEELPPAVIAVLDFKSILAKSTAARGARQQIEAYREAYQAEIAKEEEALRREEQELGRQRAILAPEAFAEKRRAFERKVTDAQRRVQDRSRQLERTRVEIRNEIGRAVTKIVAGLVGERKFNIVLDREQVLLAADKLDITGDVLRELDRQLPEIKVPLPDAD